MTHDILPADVDLANKLRSAGNSDEEVVTVLVHRGIDRGEAPQLLDDLRNGRQIITKLQKGLEATPRRRHRRRLEEPPRENEAVTESERQPVDPVPRRESHREDPA